jgi:hypothetical protein
MPIESKAQQRWAYANKDKKGSTGKAAREFIAATPKDDFKKLPERVGDKSAKRREAFYGKD